VSVTMAAPRTTALTRSLARSFASLHNAPPAGKRYAISPFLSQLVH
jgi:hypothetical protein